MEIILGLSVLVLFLMAFMINKKADELEAYVREVEELAIYTADETEDLEYLVKNLTPKAKTPKAQAPKAQAPKAKAPKAPKNK